MRKGEQSIINIEEWGNVELMILSPTVREMTFNVLLKEIDYTERVLVPSDQELEVDELAVRKMDPAAQEITDKAGIILLRNLMWIVIVLVAGGTRF